MRILVSGSSGLVGRALCLHLRRKGHELWSLVRQASPNQDAELCWDPLAGELDPKSLEGFDAVIHLAGENLAQGRWTEVKKQRLYQSRVQATKLLAQSLAKLKHKPQTFICASAIGFYGHRGAQALSEQSDKGEGFLADLCQDWEAASRVAQDVGIRTVQLRMGVVLSASGGALAKMLGPFYFGVGAVIGGGQQYVSWISLTDLLAMIEHVLEHLEIEGPVNAVAPHAVTQQQFAKTLAQVLKRPCLLSLPAALAKLMMGEMAQELLLSSTRVAPQKMLGLGFKFAHAELKPCLADLLTAWSPSTQEFYSQLYLPVPQSQAFNFFCDAKHLEAITPPWLSFHIERQSSAQPQEGTEFSYRLKIRAVPCRWRSRIVDWRPPQHFIDIQLSGPYARWEHRHEVFEHGQASLMLDHVNYALKGGLLAHLLFGAWVRRDVKSIFAYRNERVRRLITAKSD